MPEAAAICSSANPLKVWDAIAEDGVFTEDELRKVEVSVANCSSFVLSSESMQALGLKIIKYAEKLPDLTRYPLLNSAREIVHQETEIRERAYVTMFAGALGGQFIPKAGPAVVLGIGLSALIIMDGFISLVTGLPTVTNNKD